MIQIKVSLLPLAEITRPLQHFWTSLYLSSTSNTQDLENLSENQNQLFRERERPFRVSISKVRMLVVTKILTVFVVFPPYHGHNLQRCNFQDIG